MLGGDIVKDDSGNFAISTEQSAAAVTHKTAAKVFDVPAVLDKQVMP